MSRELVTVTELCGGISLQILDDFSLSGIANSGQCFRFKALRDGGYRVIHEGRVLDMFQTGQGEYHLNCSKEQFKEIWHSYFDLGECYRELRERIDPCEDAFLYRAAESGRGIRILRQNPWEMLISFIISQNRNIPAICTSIEMLARMAGKPIQVGDDCEHAFPEPEPLAALTESELRACKLGYRAEYVSRAAKEVAEGKLDLTTLARASDEAAMERLLEVHGIGKKVASCILLFGYHRLNTFPIDVWIRRTLEKWYPDGYPFERYAPYNGVYQQYMFAYSRENSDDLA